MPKVVTNTDAFLEQISDRLARVIELLEARGGSDSKARPAADPPATKAAGAPRRGRTTKA